MKIEILFVLCAICVYVSAKDFVVGTRTNNLLISTEKVKVKSYIFIKRDKDYTYIDPKQRVIKIKLREHYLLNRVRNNEPAPTGHAKFQAELSALQSVLVGIIARDLSRTDGEVSVKSGGVGATNVTLHLQSGRGEELNYLILIFSDNK